MNPKVKTLAQEEAELDYVARLSHQTEGLVKKLVMGKLTEMRDLYMLKRQGERVLKGMTT